MKYLIAVDLNTPSHLLASTLGIPQAVHGLWPCATRDRPAVGQVGLPICCKEKNYTPWGTSVEEKNMVGFGLWLGDLERDKVTV